MQRKTLGWTGVEVPVIGQGTWMIEGNPETERRAVAALRVGLDLGMTHIDTAEMYGNGRAEELVSEAIAGRRSEVFLTTKVLPSNASYQGTLRACERSLRRLRTEWVDLYLLHWRGQYPLAETMRAMEELVESGKVRYFGVSNFDVDEFNQARGGVSKGRLAANQVLYHLGDRGIERRLIPHCAGEQTAVVGYSPFGHRGFPAAGSPGSKVLNQIALRHGRTARQVVLNFLTRLPGLFAIPKASDPDHVRENSGGAGWTLAGEDEEAISRAFPAPTRDVPLGML
jgi:diketogulonate reductase-like aldo/keto reductase